MYAATAQVAATATVTGRWLGRPQSRPWPRRSDRRPAARRRRAQRELSLVSIMVVHRLVGIQAPAVPVLREPDHVTVLAAIIAIAAVGEAMVVITRNVDLSVEAMMGLVAFVVADILPTAPADARSRGRSASALGLVLGMVNGVLVAVLRRALDRRDAGDAEHLPRHRLPDRRRQAGHR